MGQWTLPGPDKLTLTRLDVCQILHVSESTLDRMIESGTFPRGVKMSASSSPIWTGADLAAYLHLAERWNRPEKSSGRGEKAD